MNILMAFLLLAGGDDPQVATDHPWYPGELSASTFERLFKTQAALYGRVTGRRKDWRVVRQGEEPADFWSQALCFGDAPLTGTSGPVRVRFRNDRKRQVLRAEMHLAYRTGRATSTEVTFAWREGKAGALKTASRTYAAGTEEDSSWTIPTGSGVDTSWVEYRSRP